MAITPIQHTTIKSFARTLLGCKASESIHFETLADDAVLSVDYYIDMFIPLAVDYCSVQSPRGGVNVSSVTAQCGLAQSIDEDFTRLVFMSFGAGRKPIAHFDDNDSALGKAQWNVYSTSKEDNFHAILHGDNKFDVFPADGTNRYRLTTDHRYNPDAGLFTENKCYLFAVCYITAAFVYEAWGHRKSAERMKNIAKRFLS